MIMIYLFSTVVMFRIVIVIINNLVIEGACGESPPSPRDPSMQSVNALWQLQLRDAVGQSFWGSLEV